MRPALSTWHYMQMCKERFALTTFPWVLRRQQKNRKIYRRDTQNHQIPHKSQKQLRRRNSLFSSMKMKMKLKTMNEILHIIAIQMLCVENCITCNEMWFHWSLSILPHELSKLLLCRSRSSCIPWCIAAHRQSNLLSCGFWMTRWPRNQKVCS